jgi:hypothetical protein
MTVLLALDLDDPEWVYSTRDCLGGERPRKLVYRMITEQLPAQIAIESESSGGAARV